MEVQTSGRYRYSCNCMDPPFGTVHVHEISCKRNTHWVFLSLVIFGFLVLHIFWAFMVQKLCVSTVWEVLFGIAMIKCCQLISIKKESVVIMPEIGLQLEMHFWSGRVNRCFVPVGKILRPVINEQVTPVTCYWNLALLLRDEDELLLVFQKLRPPVKMLVPVWKALCAATGVDPNHDRDFVSSDFNSQEQLIPS